MKPATVKTIVGIVAALALLGTFALYNQPGFMVNLADQLWSCF